jgi:hypothetical protein
MEKIQEASVRKSVNRAEFYILMAARLVIENLDGQPRKKSDCLRYLESLLVRHALLTSKANRVRCAGYVKELRANTRLLRRIVRP